MAFGTFDNDDEVMNEINMTPLVDVMLVLLIIFIITIPVINHAVKIDLPRASNKPDDAKPQSVNGRKGFKTMKLISSLSTRLAIASLATVTWPVPLSLQVRRRYRRAMIGLLRGLSANMMKRNCSAASKCFMKSARIAIR